MYQGLSLVFDIDGTICSVKKPGESYEEMVPYEDMVKKIIHYHENGARIILFTSRNMNSFNGNLV